MTDYSKITALYSRLSVGDEDRDGGESNSIQNQKIFLENYARGQHLTNIRHYIDDDESGRFFDRSAYSRMMDDVENGKIGVCIMKDLTRWGRDYLQVGNAMEIFRRNNVRFIAVNNGIDSEKPDTLEFAPFINIMSEWYAKDISKKVKTGIKTKGMSGKPIVTEAPYGYVKDPDNKDFWIIDEEAAEVVRLIFRLFIGGKNRNQIAVHLKNEQIPTPTFYMKDRGRGTCKNKTLNEDNRCKWNKATLTNILTRQEYCGDVVNFKTTKHFRDKHNHYVDRSQWHITENVHEPIISRSDFETVQRILENAPVRRPNGDGEIHPLSGLLFCKDCGSKMHIRIDYRNGGKRHVAYCSEYHKGKAKNPKCHSPHIMDADLLMQTIAEVLKKIEDYSISNRAEFEALVKKNLAMQQTDQTKKQQKRIPQITTRLEQIDKVLNKLYEDNALGTIPQDRYEQMSQKYSEEYYALKAELATLQEQLSAYENAGGRAQKFLKLTERHAAFTVVNLAPTRQRLENDVFTVSGIAQKYNCALRRLDWQQEQGFVSSLALGYNGIEIQRGMTTSSTAIFIPFMTRELRMDGQALYYGMNALSNNVIMADRKKLKSANGMYLGSTGSGKSFAAKRELINVFLATNDRIIVVDPMGEYAPLVRRLGGQVIEIAPDSPHHISPMDLQMNINDEDSPLSMKADFLLSLCELIVGGKEGLQPIEKTVIDRCVRLVYREMALGLETAKTPLLQDLYEELLRQPEPEARRVATALELYCTGSLNLFNHHTNVDLNSRVVCIVLKGLGENLRKIAMHTTNEFVTAAVNANHAEGVATWCYFDEFHILLRDPLTASYFVAVWKMLRKKGCVPSALTQNVKDLLASREIENILDNTDFMVLLSQAQSDRAILAKQLGISEHQLSYITHSNSGEGLLFYGNVTIPFVDRFPRGEIYDLLTTRPEDLAHERTDE